MMLRIWLCSLHGVVLILKKNSVKMLNVRVGYRLNLKGYTMSIKFITLNIKVLCSLNVILFYISKILIRWLMM